MTPPEDKKMGGEMAREEGYPFGWVRLDLMVSREGSYHAIGGARAPGDGDTAYLGLERIRKAHNAAVARAVEEERERCAKIAEAFTEEFPLSPDALDSPGEKIAAALRARKASREKGEGL